MDWSFEVHYCGKYERFDFVWPFWDDIFNLISHNKHILAHFWAPPPPVPCFCWRRTPGCCQEKWSLQRGLKSFVGTVSVNHAQKRDILVSFICITRSVDCCRCVIRCKSFVECKQLCKRHSHRWKSSDCHRKLWLSIALIWLFAYFLPPPHKYLTQSNFENLRALCNVNTFSVVITIFWPSRTSTTHI